MTNEDMLKIAQAMDDKRFPVVLMEVLMEHGCEKNIVLPDDAVECEKNGN